MSYKHFKINANQMSRAEITLGPISEYVAQDPCKICTKTLLNKFLFLHALSLVNDWLIKHAAH